MRSWVVNSKPSLLTKGAAEFTGCMLFQFIGSVAPTPATNAVALMVLVYYTAKLSGAHLNPALTTTFALLGYTNPAEVLVYWIAQLSGCIAGALWVALLVPGLRVGGDTATSTYGELAGCFAPKSPPLSSLYVFGWEAVGTFCFILPIFSVVWYTQSKSGYGNTGPIIVGLSLYAAATAVGPWTGAALNPARAVASQLVFRCPDAGYVGYYVAGELLGAAVVPIAVAPWYGMSMRSVMRSLHDRAYSYSMPTHVENGGSDDVSRSSSNVVDPPSSRAGGASGASGASGAAVVITVRDDVVLPPADAVIVEPSVSDTLVPFPDATPRSTPRPGPPCPPHVVINERALAMLNSAYMSQRGRTQSPNRHSVDLHAENAYVCSPMRSTLLYSDVAPRSVDASNAQNSPQTRHRVQFPENAYVCAPVAALSPSPCPDGAPDSPMGSSRRSARS